LFLDEIGDMPLALQAKLLRVLQEQELEPLGSNEVLKVDVRVIAATSRDLAAMVERGEFRADLFYRLNVLPIRLPALRERPEDIEALVEVLLEDIARRGGLPPKTLNVAALRLLAGCRWPGNVRELRNTLEQAFLMSDDDELAPCHFRIASPDGNANPPMTTIAADAERTGAPPSDLPSGRRRGSEEGRRSSQRELGPPPALAFPPSSTLPARKAELERDAIAQALLRTNGNRVAAARLLAISRATLYEKLAKYPELTSC
jgi:DNA-binding NtrC family response regulator